MNRTVEQTCAETLKQNCIDLEQAPEACIEAVKRGWRAIFDVPEASMTEDAWFEAVRGAVRELDAVSQDGRAEFQIKGKSFDDPVIALVPERFRTERVCLAAMQGALPGLHVYAGLDMVPEAARTEAVCMAAVASGDGMALRHVPDAVKTPEMCAEAVRHECAALEFVPERCMTEAVCLEALRSDLLYRADWPGTKVLQFVPEGLRTPELLLKAASTAFNRGGQFYEPLPDSCSVVLDAWIFQPDGKQDDRMAFHIRIDDPKHLLYAEGAEPSAVSTYPGDADVAESLRDLAHWLEDENFEKSMPRGIRPFCAGILRDVAGMLPAPAPAEREEEDEDAGPRP